MGKINFKRIIHLVILKPLDGFEAILIQEKYNLFYFFPFFYGAIIGISKTFNKFLFLKSATPFKMGYILGDSLVTIISMAGVTILFCFIYSWIVFFLSLLLKGLSNFKMIFSLVLYSLIPMIIGAVFLFACKLILLASVSPGQLFEAITLFLYCFQIVFIFWSLYILLIGNAMINDFSIAKSFLSSSLLIVILFAFGILAK